VPYKLNEISLTWHVDCSMAGGYNNMNIILGHIYLIVLVVLSLLQLKMASASETEKINPGGPRNVSGAFNRVNAVEHPEHE